MKRTITTALVLVAFAASAGDGWASKSCIAHKDATALEVASVQQQLMVAALTCGEISRYNRFVTSYQPELQASDANLLAFFQHSGRGAAGYHSFKTKLANEASLRSSHSPEGYCSAANAAFDDALDGNKTLDIFVAAQPIAFQMPGRLCDRDDVTTADASLAPKHARRSHHKTLRVSEESTPMD
jgi:hypothetical protein